MAVTLAKVSDNLDAAFQETLSGAYTLYEVLKAKAERCRNTTGTIASTASGTSSVAMHLGYGSTTIDDISEMWIMLKRGFEDAKERLTIFSERGTDPFSSTLGASTVGSPVIIDTFDLWRRLCIRKGIDPSTVIGQPVGDTALYLWMSHTPNLLHIMAVYERGLTSVKYDFTEARL